MIPVYNYLMFNHRSSRDYEVWISGTGTFNAPERDVEVVAVPGRNGDLTIDHGRFKNIQITYPAFIVKDFKQNFDAFKAYMCSQRGNKRLEDSYHPEYYRLASFVSAINPEMRTLNRAGSFDIIFACDPRRFLKSGEKQISISGTTTYTNRTLYTARPVFRVYGTGTLTVNGISVTVNTADGYTDIDSELQDCYKGTISCNNKVAFSDMYKTFPTIEPGENTITVSGFSQVLFQPNTWTV